MSFLWETYVFVKQCFLALINYVSLIHLPLMLFQKLHCNVTFWEAAPAWAISHPRFEWYQSIAFPKET